MKNLDMSKPSLNFIEMEKLGYQIEHYYLKLDEGEKQVDENRT